jgi:hypothetical protein
VNGAVHPKTTRTINRLFRAAFGPNAYLCGSVPCEPPLNSERPDRLNEIAMTEVLSFDHDRVG